MADRLAIARSGSGGYGGSSRNRSRSARLSSGLCSRTALPDTHGYTTLAEIAVSRRRRGSRSAPSRRPDTPPLSPLQARRWLQPGSGEGALVLPVPSPESMITAGAAAVIASGRARANRNGACSFMGRSGRGAGPCNPDRPTSRPGGARGPRAPGSRSARDPRRDNAWRSLRADRSRTCRAAHARTRTSW